MLGAGIEGVASAAECELNVALRTNGRTLTLALALALTLTLTWFSGPTATLYLPCTSPVSPLYLPCISPVGCTPANIYEYVASVHNRLDDFERDG